MIRVFKYLIVLLIVLISFDAFAQTKEDNRRIEQEKRKSLRSTENKISLKQKKDSQYTVDMGYFEELLIRDVTYLSDAFQTLVILYGVDEQYLDFESQFEFLKEQNILPKRILENPNPKEPLRKGLLSYMYCEALNIKGGVHLRLFPTSGRYSLKELEYLRIIAPGHPLDIVTGEELVSVLANAAKYEADNE